MSWDRHLYGWRNTKSGEVLQVVYEKLIFSTDSAIFFYVSLSNMPEILQKIQNENFEMTDSVFRDLTALKTNGFILQTQLQNTSLSKLFMIHHNFDNQRHGPLTRYCFQEYLPLFEMKKWQDTKKSKHQKWYWCGTRVSKQQYEDNPKKLQRFLANAIPVRDLVTIIFKYGSWIPVVHGHDLVNLN